MNQAGKQGNSVGNSANHNTDHQAGKPGHDPAHDAGHLTEEADIGSGEPSPGKQETDEAIKSIPVLPKDGGQQSAPSKS